MPPFVHPNAEQFTPWYVPQNHDRQIMFFENSVLCTVHLILGTSLILKGKVCGPH